MSSTSKPILPVFSLLGRDKNLEKFLLVLILIHITLYIIECTSIFTKNLQIQIRKVRKNNIEQGLYLVSAIIIFVVSSSLGFRAATFTESYHELKLFGYIYIISLFIAFICNSLCSMSEPIIPQLDSNGEPPPPVYNGFINKWIFPTSNGVPFLSRVKNNFFFNIAQYLIDISYRIQQIILSYIGIGIVAGYTVAYPFGLLSRSLLNSSS